MSVGVTKVSKNRQVLRATSRKVFRSAGDESSSSSSFGERLIQYATAGAASHDNGERKHHNPNAVGAVKCDAELPLFRQPD